MCCFEWFFDSLSVYINVLCILHLSICLVNADVHDQNASRTSKDFYLIESKKHGVHSNRKEVLVLKEEVVSLSKLEDIIEF